LAQETFSCLPLSGNLASYNRDDFLNMEC